MRKIHLCQSEQRPEIYKQKVYSELVKEMLKRPIVHPQYEKDV